MLHKIHLGCVNVHVHSGGCGMRGQSNRACQPCIEILYKLLVQN